MADKVITFTEPTENEITQVVVVFVDGSVDRLDVFGSASGDDGSVDSISASSRATDLNPGQITALEQLLVLALGELLSENGF